ncbi:hypothetical protein SARC_00977 [Sphaeroforma arctica JP610]|uniref:Peptidyl-prolyl cis-trans isomerase FKBP-type N-terminal domain-containing protein n=1 Tax=Sphaeroforma arctica JP610 TaxID=667725 RepID=A0A0L0GCY7_9EUKA|nr:hypothetical protein SARC_00977 [Sphaeroforma arctica JP610]KNC86882.1 hypothetical protein SARC_00977 [Sphaeroforma arctica JP610]|eukprot:XP_014160784.1 hypothetical protein SARC_00977 [Sphaeroforma arctica JP610]
MQAQQGLRLWCLLLVLVGLVYSEPFATNDAGMDFLSLNAEQPGVVVMSSGIQYKQFKI